MIAEFIRIVLSNYVPIFLVLGLVFSAVAIRRAPAPRSMALVVEKLIAWHVFFAIGVCFTWNFLMHGFFGETAARFIGWEDSPFQFEVATASLGFGLVGFVAAFRSYDLRLAAILGPSIFALGAGLGHIRQMVVAHNFAPGNAGLIFWMDFLIPLFGYWLLWMQKRHGRPE